MKRAFVFLISLSFLVPAAAQDSLTLQQAIEASLKNNYDILLTRNDSASYALDNSYAWAVFLPQLNGTAGTTWNKNNQQLKFVKRAGGGDSSVTRDAVKTHVINYSVNLNWTLFDGLKMFATRDKVAELEKLGDLGVKTQIVNTVAQVINNYYIIVRQKQQLQAILEQIGLNEDRVKLAEKKISVGLGSKPELLQARVDLNAQRAAQLQQLTLIAQLRERLNQLIGFRTGAVYQVSDSIPLNMGLQFGEFAQKFEDSNPSLLFAKKNIDIARITLRERKADLFPILSFNSSYNFTQNDNSVAVNINQPFFNRNKGFNYGFGLNVPILNGFNTKRLIKQAEIDIRYQQLVYASQRSQIDMGISNAFKDYELQKQLLQLEDENIALAKENVMIARERFKQGVSTYLELREAQFSLQDAYNRLIAARYNTKLAETELLRLKGDLVR
ncbi:TolC family protein [Paraflavitalea sp. CAU 1676]|uniref:TolC family protein n=1 Tax=Paraflavitalea sp. CAU 1676 TaxID=3032598 RepID=UPI0023DB124C|nr:TolC family protein [Paraflavitalea sp. CAU 1676]MDF2192658.1 TolC family protein [Paraflavitalea sp. CAU 1676]